MRMYLEHLRGIQLPQSHGTEGVGPVVYDTYMFVAEAQLVTHQAAHMSLGG